MSDSPQYWLLKSSVQSGLTLMAEAYKDLPEDEVLKSLNAISLVSNYIFSLQEGMGHDDKDKMRMVLSFLVELVLQKSLDANSPGRTEGASMISEVSEGLAAFYTEGPGANKITFDMGQPKLD